MMLVNPQDDILCRTELRSDQDFKHSGNDPYRAVVLIILWVPTYRPLC